MQKKESYRHILPHFQQPGQAYFVTWCLKDAISAKLVEKYSPKLELLKHQIDFQRDRKFPASEKQRLQTADPKDFRDRKFLTSGYCSLKPADPRDSRDRRFPTSNNQRLQTADHRDSRDRKFLTSGIIAATNCRSRFFL